MADNWKKKLLSSQMGLVSSAIVLPVVLGYASILCSHPALEDLAPFVSKFLIFSTCFQQFFFAMFDEKSFSIAAVQDTGIMFITAMVYSIADAIIQANPEKNANSLVVPVFTNMIVCMGFATAVCSCLLLVVSIPALAYRLSSAVQYVPVPVIGAFLSSIGIFLFRGGVGLATNSEDQDFFKYLKSLDLVVLIPTVVFGLLLLVIRRKSRSIWSLPAAMMIPLVVLIVLHAASPQILNWSQTHGLLFGSNQESSTNTTNSSQSADEFDLPNRFPQLIFALDFSSIDFSIIMTPTIIIQAIQMSIMFLIATLLNLIGLEASLGLDMNYSNELRTVGFSNLSTAVFGGCPGSRLISISVMQGKIQKSSKSGKIKWTGWTYFVVFALLSFTDIDLLKLLPKPFFGGVLCFIGADIALEWLWDGRKRLPYTDLIIMWFSLFSILFLGLNLGMAIGLGMALLSFGVQYARVTVVHRLQTRLSNAFRQKGERNFLHQHRHRILLYQLEGYLFFGTARQLVKRVIIDDLERLRSSLKHNTPAPHETIYVILDGRLLRGFDASVVSVFSKMLRQMGMRKAVLALSSFPQKLLHQFQDEGFLTRVNDAQTTLTIESDSQVDTHTPVLSLNDMDEALEWCENQLLSERLKEIIVSEEQNVSDITLENLLNVDSLTNEEGIVITRKCKWGKESCVQFLLELFNGNGEEEEKIENSEYDEDMEASGRENDEDLEGDENNEEKKEAQDQNSSSIINAKKGMCLNTVTTEQVEKLHDKYLMHLEIKPNHFAFQQGDKPDSIFFVVDGFLHYLSCPDPSEAEQKTPAYQTRNPGTAYHFGDPMQSEPLLVSNLESLTTENRPKELKERFDGSTVSETSFVPVKRQESMPRWGPLAPIHNLAFPQPHKHPQTTGFVSPDNRNSGSNHTWFQRWFTLTKSMRRLPKVSEQQTLPTLENDQPKTTPSESIVVMTPAEATLREKSRRRYKRRRSIDGTENSHPVIKRIGSVSKYGLVGECESFLSEERSFACMAVRKSRLFKLSARDFRRLCLEDPSLGLAIQGLVIQSIAVAVKENYVGRIRNEDALNK